MKITHIISTDLVRPLEDIVVELQGKGITVVSTTEIIKVIYINVPDNLDAQALRHIKGVTSVGENKLVRCL